MKINNISKLKNQFIIKKLFLITAAVLFGLGAQNAGAQTSDNGTFEFDEGTKAYNNKDYVKAMQWLMAAAEKGNSMAMVNVGLFYRMGYGVTQDYAKAREWFVKALENGYKDAKTRIAVVDEDIARSNFSNAIADNPELLVGSKWSLSTTTSERGYVFLENKKIKIYDTELYEDFYSEETFFQTTTKTGTYTFNGKDGIITVNGENLKFSIKGNPAQLSAELIRNSSYTYTWVTKFKYIKEE